MSEKIGTADSVKYPADDIGSEGVGCIYESLSSYICLVNLLVGLCQGLSMERTASTSLLMDFTGIL